MRRGGALDADFQRAFDFGVQVQFDFVFAQRLDRMFEMNLALVERDVELVLEFVGDHAGGDGAEHLAVFAGLDLDDADELRQALGEFGHGVELMGFALGAALAQGFEPALVALRHRNGEALREKVIARVAGGDFDLIGFAAEADDVVGKNDFGLCHKIGDALSA